MNIQWFPGHMAKTRKLISENLKAVDIVIILLDARIPYSSRNPEIDSIIGDKLSITVLNKADIADDDISALWMEYFKKNNNRGLLVDSNKGKGFKEFMSTIKEMAKPIVDHEIARGRTYRAIRTMVVGVPNVGKSSFINRIAGRAVANTGDRPGVTKQKQWIRLNDDVELLDTPGILWPKFDDYNVALNLAYTGAIKDDIMDIIELAAHLVVKLADEYPSLLEERYKIDLKDISKEDDSEMLYSNPAVAFGYKILYECGKKRGCLLSGGEIDYNRISAIILDEFRGCKIGRISLEKPDVLDSSVEDVR